MGVENYYFRSEEDPKHNSGSILRIFDITVGQYLKKKIGKLVLPNKEIIDVGILLSVPERAFSLLAKVGTTIPKTQEKGLYERISLPMVSYYRGSMVMNMSRLHDRFGKRWTYKYSNKDGAWFTGPKANPYTISYQVDIWTKYVDQMNQFEELFLQDFSPDDFMYLYDDKKKVVQILDVNMESITNNADIENIGKTDRILRKTMNIKIEGFIPKSPIKTTRVKSINLNIYSLDSLGNLILEDEIPVISSEFRQEGSDYDSIIL